jgi:hypothetical protein
MFLAYFPFHVKRKPLQCTMKHPTVLKHCPGQDLHGAGSKTINGELHSAHVAFVNAQIRRQDKNDTFIYRQRTGYKAHLLSAPRLFVFVS